MLINHFHSAVLDGQDVNYYLTGNGPCLVFLHGYMEDYRVWLPVARKIEGYTLLIPDMPDVSGIVLSKGVNAIQFMASLIHKLVLHLGHNSYRVLGGSLGGYVALQMLRQYSSNIEKVVLVSTNPFCDTLKRKNKRRQEIALLEAGKKDLVIKMFLHGFADQKIKAFYELMTTDVTAENLIALQNMMMERIDSDDIIKNSSCMILYIYGENDITLPKAEIEQLLQGSDSIVYKKVTEGSHFLLAEQTNVVTDFIKEFIKHKY